MTVKHELKSLRHGSNAKLDLEWLAKQPASIFEGGNNLDLLSKWNSLQNTPPKAYEFVTVVHHNPRRIIQYIEETFPRNLDYHGDSFQFKDKLEYPYYAYIWHDKDRKQTPQDLKDPEKGVHVHFYFRFKNQRSFRSLANELQVPVNMIEKVKYGTRAVLEYLTHENAPDKHHYDPSEIHSNFPVLQVIQQAEQELFDHIQLAWDYRDMRLGIMTYEQFIEKYKICIVRHSFSQAIKVFESAYNACEKGQSNVYDNFGVRFGRSARDKP